MVGRGEERGRKEEGGGEEGDEGRVGGSSCGESIQRGGELEERIRA